MFVYTIQWLLDIVDWYSHESYNGQLVVWVGALQSARYAMLCSQTFRMHPFQRPSKYICPLGCWKSVMLVAKVIDFEPSQPDQTSPNIRGNSTSLGSISARAWAAWLSVATPGDVAFSALAALAGTLAGAEQRTEQRLNWSMAFSRGV